MADHDEFPDLVTQHDHGPGFHDERTFEDALRDLVRNSPYLLISLLLHVPFFIYLAQPADVVVIEEEKSITATAEQVEEIIEEEPPPPPPPEEPEELIDDPVISEDPVAETSDVQDTFAEAVSNSNPSTLGVGSGLASFGARGGGKVGKRGQRAGSPHNKAVDAALAWLSAHQDPGGYWSANAFDDQCGTLGDDTYCTGRGHPTVDVGVTALALLAFLGAGNTDKEGRYKDTVKAGLKWLTDVQDRKSGNFGNPDISEHTYDHTIATLAMVEAYALSNKNHRFKKSAQKGIDYLMTLKNPGAAWRYADLASDEMILHPNDVSVTGWVIMVLTLAKEQKLKVDESAIEDAMIYIEEMTDPTTGRTGYNAKGGDSSRRPGDDAFWPTDKTEAMTAVAMLCRIFIDPNLERPGNEGMIDKAAKLISSMPIVWSDAEDKVGYKDFYYWYYGSYALFQLGGNDWKIWQKGIEAIAENQVQEGEMKGSWDPALDPWGADGGRVYSTAILALTLEVYYRYDTVIGAH